jgi:hypothetical protein
MATTKTYDSPDGLLRFLIIEDDDGDVLLRFDKYAWHTHGEVLALARVLFVADDVFLIVAVDCRWQRRSGRGGSFDFSVSRAVRLLLSIECATTSVAFDVHLEDD